MLTTSPEAIPSPSLGRAPSRTSASPVVTAILSWSSSCSTTQSRIAKAARTALGVVLVRGGSAEQRHHGVADELLDRSAVAFELGAKLRLVGL